MFEHSYFKFSVQFPRSSFASFVLKNLFVSKQLANKISLPQEIDQTEEMVTSKPKILLFGMSGQGLSTIANMLVSGEQLSCPLFKTGDEQNVTGASHEGRGYHVVTVGIGEETEIHCNDAVDLIFKSLKETQVVEYSHILLVRPASWFDPLADDIWKLFLKIFEGAEPSFGLIGTECRNSDWWQQENEKFLQEKYDKFILPGRYIYLDVLPAEDRCGADFNSMGSMVRRLMRQEWLESLDASLYQFFESNNFQYYTFKYDTATAKDCSTQLDSSPEEMDPIDQVFPSKPIRKVLLFGKTGQGKSTIANMLVSGELLHDPVFKTGDGMCGVTDFVTSHEGRGYHVVDTVGIGEETESHRKHATDLIYKFLKETQGEYSHILFVIPAGRFDQLDDDISKIFPKIFKGAKPAFGVVVTKCRNSRTWQQENEKLLQERYGKFILPGRYVYIDFPPLEEDVEMENLLRNKREKSLESLEMFLERFHDEFQYYKPEYATAPDASLLSFAKELLLGLFNFVKFKIFRCREL